MNSKERVRRAISFNSPDRIPIDFPLPYTSDFHYISMNNHIDSKLSNGIDEWGVLWQNCGNSKVGEVKDFPIKSWSEFDFNNIPDISDETRWKNVQSYSFANSEKFVIAKGISIYERVHFLRGMENTWMDIYEEPEYLNKLINILVEMNIYSIDKYADAGADAYMFNDDWGLQERLMINPRIWRKIWKPAYQKIYKKAHSRGLNTILHSCGYIIDILEDLIEIGLDVIQMNQQKNMGLDNLSNRFKERITFFCPADIQQVLPVCSIIEIKNYCNELKEKLSSEKGGFMAKSYSDFSSLNIADKPLQTMYNSFI
jgi:uroporphyrinogen decarboxylase